RAGRELHLSWAAERTFGSKTANRQPSPWIAVIEAAGGRTPPSAKPGGRASLRLMTQATDSVLLAELKDWRRQKVRASNAPAYTVFDDKTLAAIANGLPRSEDDLLRVSGVGPVKLSRYGDEVLAIIARHTA
ncbi:MAG: ATP-dependent helicase UvrD/PcrA, partial [Acidimicrobiaceae bacterium]|nr:ATP-dependent helicase UvrD/PcrA [Acidimicrobiaceae bacterium]